MYFHHRLGYAYLPKLRHIEMRIEGYSFDEIGVELGIKKGNARVRACHGYKKLKNNKE